MKRAFPMVPGSRDAYNVERFTICHLNVVFFFFFFFSGNKVIQGSRSSHCFFYYIFFLISKKSPGQSLVCVSEIGNFLQVFTVAYSSLVLGSGSFDPQRGEKMSVYPVGNKTHPGAKRTPVLQQTSLAGKH